MRTRLLAGLLACLACSDSSSTAQDYVGTWHLAVSANAQCWPAFDLTFFIDADDVAGYEGQELFNTISTWHFTETPGTGGVTTGNVNFHDRTFEIQFNEGSFHTVFEGTGPSSTRLTGTFSDPDGIVSTTPGCTGSAVAQKG